MSSAAEDAAGKLDKPAKPPKRSLAKVLVSVGILTLAVGAVTVVAVLPGRDRKVPPKEVEPVNVEVMEVRPRQEVAETFLLHGQVEANRVVDVSAEVDGRIRIIHLQEGRPCGANVPLIQLDTDLLDAEMRRAKATSELDQREYDRIKELGARGAATTTEIDQARAKADASKAALDLATAKLNRTKIATPVQGVLNRIPVEVGEYVTAGTKVAQIVQIDPVKVVVDVPERVISSVHLNDKHTVIVDRPPSRRQSGTVTYVDDRADRKTGTVTYIAELADPMTRTTRVEMAVPNPKHELRSGQILQVDLRVRVHPNAIMVPLLAVIPLEEGRVVYVVEGGQAVRRDVELGFMKGSDPQTTQDPQGGDRVARDGQQFVQVTKGLKAGDRLIVKGHQLVGPGQAVRVVTADK